MTIMTIEKFRHDLVAKQKATGVSQVAISNLCRVHQPGLSKFINGHQKIGVEDMIKLWPFVYGQSFPSPRNVPHDKQ